MNSMAPDLSGLVPYVIAFMAVAVVGAVMSLAIVAQAVAAFVLVERRPAPRGPTASWCRVISSEEPSPRALCVSLSAASSYHVDP
jgi:hypothetical protein